MNESQSIPDPIPPAPASSSPTGVAQALSARFPGVTVVCADFLEWTPPHRFDVIVANPPFTRGADIEHTEAAYPMLLPGGLLVTLCMSGTRQREELGALADAAGGSYEVLPPGSFSAQGTDVNVALVTLPAHSTD